MCEVRGATHDVMMKQRLNLIVGIFICFLVVFLDQYCKQWALSFLSKESVLFWENVVALRLVFNDASFGIFLWGIEVALFFSLISLVILLLVVSFYSKSFSRNGYFICASAFIVGGAISNGIDRFYHGAVVDWIEIVGLTVFNLADVAITVGLVLLFLVVCKWQK